jgi:hypothetical protein
MRPGSAPDTGSIDCVRAAAVLVLGVCECDAVAVSATAQGYVDADPNNPN